MKSRRRGLLREKSSAREKCSATAQDIYRPDILELVGLHSVIALLNYMYVVFIPGVNVICVPRAAQNTCHAPLEPRNGFHLLLTARIETGPRSTVVRQESLSTFLSLSACIHAWYICVFDGWLLRTLEQ